MVCFFCMISPLSQSELNPILIYLSDNNINQTLLDNAPSSRCCSSLFFWKSLIVTGLFLFVFTQCCPLCSLSQPSSPLPTSTSSSWHFTSASSLCTAYTPVLLSSCLPFGIITQPLQSEHLNGRTFDEKFSLCQNPEHHVLLPVTKRTRTQTTPLRSCLLTDRSFIILGFFP